MGLGLEGGLGRRQIFGIVNLHDMKLEMMGGNCLVMWQLLLCIGIT